VRLGKCTARLVQEATVLGYVNGAWSATASPPIPPDLDVLADVLRAARNHADLYPVLSRAEFPDDHPIVAHMAAQDADRLAAIRALIERGVR